MEIMLDIIVIAHNIRSTHNIGALLRTADGFGVTRLIMSGYSPYPIVAHDTRLPHLARRQTAQIHKTALGAETTVPCEYQEIPNLVALKEAGYSLIGLEQDVRSVALPSYTPPAKVALLLGEETQGLTDALRDACDVLLEIPMRGQKESFNVSVAAGIALYGLMTKS